VGTETETAGIVLAEAEVIVEKVALGLARHRVERRPAGLGVERVVEELLDPCRIERFRGPAPLPRDGPGAIRAPSHRGRADRHVRARLRALEARAVRPRPGRRRLEVPPMRRSATTFARGRDLLAM